MSLDPYKYSFPNAVPGGGGSIPPATATMMWAGEVRQSYDQALGAHKKIISNAGTINSILAKMAASVAAAEQAKLAAESSAAAAFARDNGFSVAAASSAGFSGSSGVEVALGLVGAVSQAVWSSTGEAVMGSSSQLCAASSSCSCVGSCVGAGGSVAGSCSCGSGESGRGEEGEEEEVLRVGEGEAGEERVMGRSRRTGEEDLSFL